ncbi:tripartite tricarboxylate transporter substrate binding protein [Salinicola sp. DM10]|uniref:Bug family tripartite tricarboxylate transporter substrate binding protein n=1 Tax=Salinicola sp. DM10 TaxID=2815721 RepID=UPI001A8F08B0|nr:tripartite tricarboxylate transporter substrate binding protein [Salinicola sp. DM10]MCE3026752.1 tripartite tricarboxylate transporter substrate binding protein [Salinicola sp. DM10]
MFTRPIKTSAGARRRFSASAAIASLVTGLGLGSLGLGSLGLGMLGASPAAQAEDYPDHAIEFIVPWSPGGGSDALMRVISNAAEQYLGQPLPVINMPGVSGTLGLKALAQKAPDGYTLGQIHEGLMAAHATGLTPLDWDDFQPIASLASSPQYLVVNADSGWETFADFAAYAKANPGKVRFGATLGGIPHVHGAMIEDAIGTSFRYVGYEGTGARIRGLVGGHIDAAIGDISSSLGFVDNGDLRFLAVGTPQRPAQTPDVPTFKELGYPGLKLSINRGLVAPKGIDPAKVETLAADFEEMSKDPAFVDKMRALGAGVEFMGPNAYADYLAEVDATVQRLSGKLAR